MGGAFVLSLTLEHLLLPARSSTKCWVVRSSDCGSPLPSLPTYKLTNGHPPRKGRVIRDLAERIGDWLPHLPRATESDSDVVYVMQALEGGPVKIGHTTYDAIERRRKELQTGNPQPLVVRALYSGGLWLEQALHEYFVASRLQGEWFSLTPAIVALCPEVVLDGR